MPSSLKFSSTKAPRPKLICSTILVWPTWFGTKHCCCKLEPMKNRSACPYIGTNYCLPHCQQYQSETFMTYGSKYTVPHIKPNVCGQARVPTRFLCWDGCSILLQGVIYTPLPLICTLLICRHPRVDDMRHLSRLRFLHPQRHWRTNAAHHAMAHAGVVPSASLWRTIQPIRQWVAVSLQWNYWIIQKPNIGDYARTTLILMSLYIFWWAHK